MDIQLNDIEARVLGCLIEKSMATPEYYPMTVNSLKAACNQKSNREPVMQLDENAVVDALDALRYTHHLVSQVTTSGSRAPKYRHEVPNKLPFGAEQDLALMCELLLRGPQTAGELRTHARRLCEVESVATVVDTMGALSRLEPDPMVVQLPPGPGRREPRYAHLLCGEVHDAMPPVPTATPEEAPSPQPRQNDRISSLEADIESLQTELQALRDEFASFRKQFE